MQQVKMGGPQATGEMQMFSEEEAMMANRAAKAVDPEEAELRMMSLVDRMEKWNNQKKISKWIPSRV